MIGCVQPGTSRGTFLQMIGSRKMTPPRMLRMVPFGDLHIFLRLNSFDPRLVGRDGRALDADAVLLDRLGRLDGDLVVGGVAVLDAQVVILQVDVEVGQDQLVLDELPDDPGHLVAVEFDNGIGDLDLRHGAATFGMIGGGERPGRRRLLITSAPARAKTGLWRRNGPARKSGGLRLYMARHAGGRPWRS